MKITVQEVLQTILEAEHQLADQAEVYGEAGAEELAEADWDLVRRLARVREFIRPPVSEGGGAITRCGHE